MSRSLANLLRVAVLAGAPSLAMLAVLLVQLRFSAYAARPQLPPLATVFEASICAAEKNARSFSIDKYDAIGQRAR
jgi:hypothetical protein